MKHLINLLLLAGVTFTVQAQTDCGLPHDINNNGSVDIEDFLSILGLFGDQDSDGDGVYDSLDNCFDPEACNFMEPDAAFCLFPDAVGDCNGNCPLDEDGDGVCDSYSCGTSVSYQGYDYATVLIGEQCWFAENLRSLLYQNGDSLPINSSAEWSVTGAVANYGSGNSTCHNHSTTGDACDEEWSLENYGLLYNGLAISDARMLCPSGWHVPSDDEWISLEIFLGMDEEEAMSDWFRGTTEGAMLKTTAGWKAEGIGTNSVGFSGEPAGYKTGSSFVNAGEGATWWSSSPSGIGEKFWTRYLQFNSDQILRGDAPPSYGYSVRCIQDQEE